MDKTKEIRTITHPRQKHAEIMRNFGQQNSAFRGKY